MKADEVQRELEAAGLKTQQRTRLTNGTGYQLRFEGGEIVNVFDNGNLSVQGRNPDLVRLILGLDEIEKKGAIASRKVFVVYGHDGRAKTQLEAMLRRWGLEPLIMDQLPSEGQTLIEKLEKYTCQEVGFAVVLATPDDEGHTAGRPDEKKFRARQNVVLELGLLLARLGRAKVAVLLKNQVAMERPSDIQGLIYLPFEDDVEETNLPLAKEMVRQGLSIDLSKL